LEEEVKQLDTERAEEEKLMREKLKVLEAEKHDRKIELERKAIKLSSMEKVCCDAGSVGYPVEQDNHERVGSADQDRAERDLREAI
jgi:hypothetical protein